MQVTKASLAFFDIGNDDSLPVEYVLADDGVLLLKSAAKNLSLVFPVKRFYSDEPVKAPRLEPPVNVSRLALLFLETADNNVPI